MHSIHLSSEALFSQSNEWKNHVLGGIGFSASTSQSNFHATGFPFAPVNMAVLEGADSACEIWISDYKVTHAQHELIQYSDDNHTLFGVLQMPHSDTDLAKTTESAFKQIFQLLQQRGYTHIFRFWNYLADINGDNAAGNSGQLERYRQFNLGRQNAFLAAGREITGNLPAACALGTANGPLTVAFIAGRTASTAIENPRQISAYQYPEQYGPRSPIFSRANLVCFSNTAYDKADLAPQNIRKDKLLFISGTASIVGHKTYHPADVAAQTRETMVNIQTVIQEANKKTESGEFYMDDLLYRVYLRNLTDLPIIRAEMSHILGHRFKAVFLHADICRKDLLVEIEATAANAIRMAEKQYA